MKRLLLFSLMAFILIACKDDEKVKYKFMEKVIEEPEKIEEYINRIPQLTSPFKSNFMEDERNKEEKLSFLKKIISNNFDSSDSIICDMKYETYNAKWQVRSEFHNIIYKGNDPDWNISFLWVKDLQRWRLFDIKFESNADCERIKSKVVEVE